VLDRLAVDLHAKGEVRSTYSDQPFSERLIRLCQDRGRILHQHFDFTLPTRGIREDTPIWLGPAVFSTLRHPGLLDAVECLIGPEIYSNPIQHVRLKLPEARAVRDANGKVVDGVTAWHQDNGVVLPEADETRMLTVWFPLWDASIEGGCLQVIPRSKERGLIDHCPLAVGGVSIPDKLLAEEKPVPVPMRRGDALFMHRLTCHSSLPNRGTRVRWSFDLRFNPIGEATGRGMFPGFVARSRAHPETELHDAEKWAAMWREARQTLAHISDSRPAHRWNSDAPVCA
jgi:phytanoyl-CoA hydroxylase